jgi:hypothetical protein
MGRGSVKARGLDVALFWMSVRRSSVFRRDGACWLWAGAKVSGYGHITRRSVQIQAHRYAWELINGPVPNGKWILHKCDVRACVRPSHLFVGDHKENMLDMRRKGRKLGNNGNLFGETHGCSKLYEHQVRAIRGLAKEGAMTQREIAERFCVTQATVSAIHKRRAWRHLDAD